MAIGKERNYPCSRRQKSWCMSWLQPTTRGLAVRCRAAGTQIGCGALWLVHGFAALHGGAAGLPADGKAAHCHGENVHHMTLSAPPPPNTAMYPHVTATRGLAACTKWEVKVGLVARTANQRVSYPFWARQPPSPPPQRNGGRGGGGTG